MAESGVEAAPPPACRAIFKFGGAAITDKSKEETLNQGHIDVLAKWTKECVDSFDKQGIAIVHGAGSFGHQVAAEYGLCDASQPWGDRKRQGFCKASLQVATLNKAVASALVTAGVHAKSLGLFGSWATDKRELVARDLTPPREALHAGLVPVMHGDCVADASLGGTVPSGDVVTRELAMELRPEYVVFVTDVDGVFTRPPGQPGAELVREVAVGPDGTWRREGIEMTTAAHDTTGGIEGKVREAAGIASAGISVLIVRAGSESCRQAMLRGPAAVGPDFQGTHVFFRPPAVDAAPKAPTSGWVPEVKLAHSMWGEPDCAWQVRGPNYLKDNKKIPAGRPRYKLVAVDMFLTPAKQPTKHIAPYLTWLPKCPHDHLVFCNILTAYGSGNLNLVVAWATESAAKLDEEAPKFSKMLRDFCEKDDAHRNNRFKLIPSIANASWIIQTAVGTKPALLGKKITMTYYRTRKYLEMCIDVRSSLAAATAVRLVSGSCAYLVVDLAILMESQHDNELPEEILGHVRFNKVDLSKAVPLDPSTAPKWDELPMVTETPL